MKVFDVKPNHVSLIPRAYTVDGEKRRPLQGALTVVCMCVHAHASVYLCVCARTCVQALVL